MAIFRTIAAIVVGYLVYAFGSMLLVGPVMSSSGISFMVLLGLIGLALIALVSGFVTIIISSRKKWIAVSVVAGLVVVATVANLVLQLGAEPLWYKLGTLLITAPGIFLVGFIKRKQGSESETPSI